MLTTLEKGLIKTGFFTALTLFLSNILVTLGSIRLYNWLRTWLFIPGNGVFWVTLLLLLLPAGVICFIAGMQTARISGEADIGWALSCLACLVAGLATTVVLMGVYIIFFILIPDHSPYNGDMGRVLAWQTFYPLLVICGAFFIFAQGLCCGVLAGWIGSKLGERWADEPSSTTVGKKRAPFVEEL